jgi:hypothetical protein
LIDKMSSIYLYVKLKALASWIFLSLTTFWRNSDSYEYKNKSVLLLQWRRVWVCSLYKYDIVIGIDILIPMSTNCAPLLADLFLYSYESEFLQNLVHSNCYTCSKSHPQ